MGRLLHLSSPERADPSQDVGIKAPRYRSSHSREVWCQRNADKITNQKVLAELILSATWYGTNDTDHIFPLSERRRPWKAKCPPSTHSALLKQPNPNTTPNPISLLASQFSVFLYLWRQTLLWYMIYSQHETIAAALDNVCLKLRCWFYKFKNMHLHVFYLQTDHFVL